MRRARRTDANLTAIVDTFRRLGCSVDVTNDIWDLTVGAGGRTVLIEVKNPENAPSKKRLTPRADLFRKHWKGAYRVVESEEEARKVVYECLLGG